MSIFCSSRSLFLQFLCATLLASSAQASALVRGAYYRLGEDDPGAVASAIGNDPTIDSFGDKLDLTRYGSPRYWADVPARGPLGDSLSMAFANEGLGGPAFPGVYGRSSSLSMIEQGYALETWVKAGPTGLDQIRNNLIAYNGDPASNGFGFFLHSDNYVARVGGFERALGPATEGEWHHLAYVQSLGTVDYYYDGKLVAETTKDPLPAAAKGGFWLAGTGDPLNNGAYLFNGWIDEVRYQSFNPLSAGAFDPTKFLISPAPEVVGRHLFYNNSKFDGNNHAANASDDAAIAPDKVALLPGGTATFANYSSSSKGINGIALDIRNLPADLTSGDFNFEVGNSNDPTSWSQLTTEPTIAVRQGAGEGGSDRVELIWADGSILKEWLQVTLKANDHTGLAGPDVFYFGNAAGEAGNAPGNALVSAFDEIEARNDPHNILNPATITNRHDYTRDGFVNAADQIAARNNGTTLANALRLIHVPPSLAVAPVPEPAGWLLFLIGAIAVATCRASWQLGAQARVGSAVDWKPLLVNPAPNRQPR